MIRIATAMAAVLLIPALALACPQCAGREEGNGLAIWLLIGTMVALPYGITMTVLRLIRRHDAADATDILAGK